MLRETNRGSFEGTGEGEKWRLRPPHSECLFECFRRKNRVMHDDVTKRERERESIVPVLN